MPASAFRGGDTADTALQRLQKYVVHVLNCVWKLVPSISPRFLYCFFPVVHPHLYVRPRNICFDGRLQTTDCLLNDVQKGAVWW